MRLLRLRLKNYRGVGSSEVQFGVRGLTIVEGPNEAGKTSLGEAIRILFEYPDSSKHKNVSAIRPVHRDAGPEIELEAESGPYHFTYFKRFCKKPETSLSITSPKSDSHTGREAHGRAEEILRNTIDVDLWKALCIQQGDAIEQANLSKQTSLSMALDAAAGGHQADPREESLFDKVRDEHARYFTERGGEKKDLQRSQKDLEESEQEVVLLTQQIQELEQDIERAATLRQELKRLNQQEQELRTDVAKYTESLDEIRRLEMALETTSLKLDSAKKSEEAARREKQVRQDLIDHVAKVRGALEKLDISSASSTELVREAECGLQQAESKSNMAEARRKDAETLLNLRRADHDYFNNKLHLEQLRERKERIDLAREKADLAEELLAKNQVDDVVLKAIQKAEHSLITAQAKLETGAPTLLLRGLADLDLQIEDQPATLSASEERRMSVPDRIRVTVPGSLQIEVTAGASASDLQKKVEVARQKLEKACNQAGVSNPGEAGKAFEERREALQAVERQKDVEADNLRDLAYDELERKVRVLGQSVPAYPSSRADKPALADDLESAAKYVRYADSELQEASAAWEQARAELDTARKTHEKLKERAQKEKVERNLKAEDVTRDEEKLTRSRANVSDDQLEARLSKATQTVRNEQDCVTSAETALRDKQPERIRALAETAAGSLRTVKEKRGAASTENTEVQTRLKVHGEEGLHEKLQAAQSKSDRLRNEDRALRRRAQAARLLYVTMKNERETARRAYVAPLKERIERLGHLLFNDSFTVDLTEDLTVASRAMDGSSVPFASLSGGTKEQISLISRLACAMTVSQDGGASLILDDALGYTDPERLKMMGAILATAAKECQIIILTCVPDRYSNVGEATVVRLG